MEKQNYQFYLYFTKRESGKVKHPLQLRNGYIGESENQPFSLVSMKKEAKIFKETEEKEAKKLLEEVRFTKGLEEYKISLVRCVQPTSQGKECK